MSYSINLSDGTLAVTIPPGVRNRTAFSITILGRNAVGYGEIIAENFVHMLEHFANITPPDNPIRGQLWYDTNTEVIRVYNGTQFISIQTSVSTTQPTSPSTGDMFFNENQEQLYIADSSGTFKTAGKPGGLIDNFFDDPQVQATRYGTYVQNLYLLEAGTLRTRAVLAVIYEWNGTPTLQPTLVPSNEEQGKAVLAIWSDHDTFTADATSPLSNNILSGFPGRIINKGLNLRLGNPLSLHTPLGILSGGTGANTAATARANLGAVNIAGDTMTGNLSVGAGTSTRFLTVNGGNGFNRDVRFSTSGSQRWTFRTTLDTETGGNVGSNFQLIRRNDTGVSIGTPLFINRTTGDITIEGNVALTVPLPITSGGTGANSITGAKNFVLNRTSEALVDEIGTYAMLEVIASPSTTNPGDTRPGSELRFANTTNSTITQPTGTWRCMGFTGSGAGETITLWLRVS